jgi:spore coat polysaccharide biosynthesis predicted glycosyltransferase SpsG
VNLVDTPEDLETTEQHEQVIFSVMQQDRETPEGFYAGPAYAILREQFRGRQKELRETPRLVLLSFGGSDPQGLTLQTAQALVALDPAVQVVAVAGPAFGRVGELKELAARLPRALGIVDTATAGHIAELMLEADVMVGSGGMSVYEIAALGTPGIILGQNAREDRRMREFARHGTVEYLGLGTEVTSETLAAKVNDLLADVRRRRDMSARGRALVDGLGAARAAEVVLELRRKQVETAAEGEGKP